MRIAYLLTGLALVLTPASGQHIHHHEGMTAEVDQFYSTWLRPNGSHPRVMSCCNRIDCYPAQTQYRGGHWWVQIRETQRWVIVPDTIVEHEQADPRESPDGRAHVCASPYGHVYCFVVALQT